MDMVCKNCGGDMYEITDPSYGCKCDTCGIIYRVSTSMTNWMEDRNEMEEGD